MQKQIIRLILGASCLLASGLTQAQSGLEKFLLSGWGYPTGYTEQVSTFNFYQSSFAADQQTFFHVKSRYPALTFLVTKINGTEVTAEPHFDLDHHYVKTEDFGLYLSYRSSGNIYFRGIVGGPLYANTNGIQNYLQNGHNIDLEYGGAIGLRLGERGAFNLELEFLGRRLTGESNMISIGARYQF